MSEAHVVSRRVPHLLLVAFLLTMTVGCASRTEIVQFQADHNEFRARLDVLNNETADLNKRLDDIELQLGEISPQVDTLIGLLGGNVREYMREQEGLIRSLKADQASVSGELERLIMQLSSRVAESDDQVQSLLLQLDTFNQLAASLVGDSLANEAMESQRLFQQSYSDYLRGEFEVARMGFEVYVEAYPTNSMADDALYWAAESWLSEEEPDSARALFIQLEDRFPESNRMATVLLKRAIIRAEQEDYEGAARLYERVIADYPKSDEAVQARIRLDEIEQMKAEMDGAMDEGEMELDGGNE
ncbi:tetratricopeptide repeat protein [bacterium]|nr:tetratricopeptide repeat protein [bacterium]